ncbi:MAG: gamma-glutamyl-gamma-aminobutyrate hydrolase family protein [Myxococcales bacterium]|nr:gamma-glutamyl-gamma-aminobutyrate hydrolase family protein [Myxococcales bacterium]
MIPHHGHGRRPSIGITPDIEAGPAAEYRLRSFYADAVFRAGGLPMVLPFSDDRACVESYLDRIGGLLVTGGAFDIPPEAYGETPRDGLGPTKPARTRFERALLEGALARKLPILGVCGGMQLLAVVLGETLVQDILREVPNARDHEQKHDRSQPHHPVEVKEGSLLCELIGKGQVMVNSTHHQAVKAPGRKVAVAAVAPDGVVEGIEATSCGFAVGVQWHPELMLDTVPLHLGLYRGLVQRARDKR